MEFMYSLIAQDFEKPAKGDDEFTVTQMKKIIVALYHSNATARDNVQQLQTTVNSLTDTLEQTNRRLQALESLLSQQSNSAAAMPENKRGQKRKGI